jgi:small subunit ribosomal protein S16
MPVKMRLARHGRKRNAFYYIVVADGRAPRDGNFIERIGDYNPNTNPATINLDFEKALNWLQNGAQPTDTMKAILSYEGVLYKKHLQGGVTKGSFDQVEAEKRFDKWKQEKEAKIQDKRNNLAKSASQLHAEKLKQERKVNEARLEEISRKNSELLAKANAPEQTEETTSEEAVADVSEENSAE